MDSLLQDFRYSFRTATQSPRFAVAAVTALSIGIAATAIIFSVFFNLLVAPFPYANAHRIITFSIQNLTSEGGIKGRDWFSVSEFLAFREQNHVFDDVVGYNTRPDFLFNDGIGTRQFSGAAVTANTFDFYGIAPLLGRAIKASDGAKDAPPVVVLDFRLWQKEFGRDPKVLSTSIVLDGVPRTIVGVMPRRFNPYGVSLWIPFVGSAAQGTLTPIARLKSGVADDAAAAELNVIAHRISASETGFFPRQYTVVVTNLVDRVIGDFRDAIYALLAAVGMLLLIACMNVANLLLARTTTRGREMAIRAALGASRSRIVGQLLIESFIFASIACLVSLALTYFGLKGINALIPLNMLPREADIALNFPVLTFAVGITVMTAITCGLVPAYHAVRGHLNVSLTGTPAAISSNSRYGLFRSLLVVSEVAFSIVLLVGAGLMMRSFWGLVNKPLPFNPATVMYARVALPRDYYQKPDRKPEFFAQLLPGIAALPGVVSVTESLMIPPDEGSWTDVEIPGKPHSERWVTDIELCTEDYFRTLDISLMRGRVISRADVQAARPIAVVNESLARNYFGAEDPIGHKIKFEVFDRPFVDAPHQMFFEIIGVVADYPTRPERTGYVLRPEAYLPASVAGFGRPLHIIARTQVPPDSLVPSVSHLISQIDPNVALQSAGSIRDLLNSEFKMPEFESAIVSTFAAVSLILVSLGVFSLNAYIVSLRTHEIGIRMAIGAQPRDVLRMVLAKATALAGIGMTLGVLASVITSRLISAQLWGVSPTDVWSLLGGCAVVTVATLIACFLPALRASRVDPAIVLRCE